MIKATFIFGSDAVRHYDQTGEIPAADAFSDSGCLVRVKHFPTQEAYKTYTGALDDYDGFSDYRVADREETPPVSIDARIKEMLRAEPYFAIFLSAGIQLLMDHIADLPDEDLRDMFEAIFAPNRIRETVRIIHNRLNGLPDDHQPD